MPTTPSKTTAAKILRTAAAEIGYREGSNNSNKFGRYFGVDGTAWCAQFVSWCAEKAGASRDALFPETAWCPDLLAFARKKGLIVRDPVKGDRSGTPAPGDVMLVQRRPGESGYSKDGAKHVGLVEKYLGDGYIQTIEGNTSNNGSAQGNGVYRLKRKLTDQLVIFRPVYDKAPPAPKPPAPTGKVVDLSQLIAAAKADPKRKQGGTTTGSADDVKLVEAALKKEGLLVSKYASDGAFGSVTVTAYSAWQRRCGYSGSDANGIPGKDSLTRLGKKHGWSVKA